METWRPLSFPRKKKNPYIYSVTPSGGAQDWYAEEVRMDDGGWWYRGRIFLSVGFLSTGALHPSRVALSLLDTHQGAVRGPRWTGRGCLRVSYRLLYWAGWPLIRDQGPSLQWAPVGNWLHLAPGSHFHSATLVGIHEAVMKQSSQLNISIG